MFCTGISVSLKSELGGTGNWITQLVQYYKNTFPEDEIALCTIDPIINQFSSEVHEGVKVYRIPSFKHEKIKIILFNWLGLIDPYKNIITDSKMAIEIFKPDIIQLFGFENQFTRIIGTIEAKLVTHIQGFIPACKYKHFIRIGKFELLRTQNFLSFITGNFLNLNLTPYKLIKDYYFNNWSKVEYVIGRTEWDRFVLKSVAPQAKYFFCQEILRKQFYDFYWKPPIKQETYKILTLSGNGGIKNIDIIYETIKILELYHPGFIFEWRIIGINEKSIIPQVMKKRGFNSSKIKLLGNKKADEIINEMKLANLFVYPTGLDNSSNALMEALLFGMPVVTTSAGGSFSLVDHKFDAYVVSEGEPYNLCGAIIELCEQPELSQQMGNNARRKALIRNSPETIVNNLKQIYLQLLK